MSGSQGRSWGADEHDRALLRSATQRIALQSAALLALVVALAVVGAAVIFDHAQHAEINRTVRQTATTADDVGDPPVGVVLIERRAGEVQVTHGAPAALEQLAASSSSGLGSATVGSRHYVTYADVRGQVRFVAAYDLAGHHRTEVRLLWTSLVAGALGVLVAAGAGLLIGRRAVRPLATAMALQRRFVTDASHELRTPLTVLHTRAQLLRRRLADHAPSEQLRELDQLVEDSSALGEVVADLLLSAQLQREDMSGESVDVAALAVAIVSSLRPYAEESRVRLSSEIEPGEWHVSGAPAALRRALVALVDNAISHTEAGGSVTVVVEGRGSLVRVCVVDDGEGVDPAQAGELTERFARGPAAGGRGRRFGLGLALVAEVVRAHHGTLEIDGAPGEGAQFAMVLPRA